MKKQLLFGLATLTAISVNAQKTYKTIANPVAKKMETFKVLPKENSNINKSAVVSHATKKVAGAPYKRFSSSSNLFGLIVAESRALNYNAAANTVGFIHRAGNNTITSLGSTGNTGTIMYSWSSNNGTSWDSTILATSATKFNRYPTGAMYNPLGNTSPANLVAVGTGPWHPGANWQGDFFASKQLGAGYTATPGPTTYMDNLALTGTQKKQDFTRIEMQVTADGIAHVLGGLYSDANATTVAGQAWRGAMLNKGTYSAGSFTWAHDSLKPSFKSNSTGAKESFTSYNQAWSENGLTGYVYFFGVDAAAAAGTSQNTYQPLVYKTINGGATWARHAALFDFTTLPSVDNRLRAVRGSTTLGKPFIAPGEGVSGTVDAAGNLHIFTSMTSAFSDNIDSLGYTYSPNYNTIWNYLFDFKTTSTGWDAVIIDSLSCAGTTTTSSQWTSSTGNLAYDARLQISRTPDGNNIFYSWADTDSTLAAGTFPHESVNPDIFMMGYDVTLNKMTCKKNMSAGKPGIAYNSFYFYASPTVAKPNATTFLIPATISKGADGGFNADTEIDHFYIDDNTFTTTEFTVTVNTPGCVTATGVGINELNTVLSTVNFYPNPASVNGTIELVLTDNAKMEVAVLNCVGQVVYTTAINGLAGANKVNIDLSSLSNGIYFYQIKSANSKSVTKKFVVSK